MSQQHDVSTLHDLGRKSGAGFARFVIPTPKVTLYGKILVQPAKRWDTKR